MKTGTLALTLVVAVFATPTEARQSAVSQVEGEAKASYEAGLTPWGDPDLQGTWGNATLTPFERPAALADREFLTEQEAADAERGRAAMLARADESGPPKTEAPPPGGNVGAYNMAWMDLGTKVVPSLRTSLVIDPKDGRVPARPEAEAVRDHANAHSAEDFEYMSIWDRCITRGIPAGMFPAGYNNYYRILQTPGYVVIFYEMIHDARIIPLTNEPHSRSGLRSWNGEARGRWEGHTLVVETTHFNGQGWIATSASQGRVKGLPQSPDTRIVERFTRTDDGTIDWQVTIFDPKVYTAPWTVAIPLLAEPGLRIFEYACHEGNQAVGNILRGARFRETDGAKGE